jgi:hypothetical protein
MILFRNDEKKIQTNYEWIKKSKEKLEEEYQIQDFVDMNYLDWVEYLNKDLTHDFEEKDDLKLRSLTAIKLLINGIRGL